MCSASAAEFRDWNGAGRPLSGECEGELFRRAAAFYGRKQNRRGLVFVGGDGGAAEFRMHRAAGRKFMKIA